MELFPRNEVVGVFRGFQKGGLEFHADIALPYQTKFNNIPMHGQFILVQLQSPDEAVLGRITSLSSEGRLASGIGEDYSLRTLRDEREVTEEIRNACTYRARKYCSIAFRKWFCRDFVHSPIGTKQRSVHRFPRVRVDALVGRNR